MEKENDAEDAVMVSSIDVTSEWDESRSFNVKGSERPEVSIFAVSVASL